MKEKKEMKEMKDNTKQTQQTQQTNESTQDLSDVVIENPFKEKTLLDEIISMLKKTLEVIAVILFIFFEKLIWEKLALPFKEWIDTLEISKKFGGWLGSQNNFVKFWFFILPLILAEGMGIWSGAIILSGSVMLGLFVYLLKVPVAGLTFWILGLVREDLLKLGWFNTSYYTVVKGFNWVKNTKIYKSVMERYESVKEKVISMKGDGGFIQELKIVYYSVMEMYKEKSTEVRKEVQPETKKTKKSSDEIH